MKEVKAAIVLIFICAVACFGALFLTSGCKFEEIVPRENVLFKKRVKFVDSIKSEDSETPLHMVVFMEIDKHRYILYYRNPGMNGAIGGMVHDPECKFCKEKK